MLLVRAGMLLAALVATAVFGVLPGFHAVTVVALVLSAVLAFDLARSIDRTNAELRRFLEAARNDDFSARFGGHGADSGFGELFRSFDDLNSRFRSVRSGQEEEIGHLRALVEQVPAPLLTVLPDGELRIQNNAARRLFGAEQPHRIEDLSRFGEDLALAVAKTRPGERRLVTMTVDGEEQRMTVSASEIAARGRIERLVSIQDIRSELEREQLDAWQGLVRVLTHEIMNSITPVASLARSAEGLVGDVVRGGELPGSIQAEMEDVLRAVETVARRSESLTKFVESYRKLTRLPPPSPRRFVVRPFLDSIVALFAGESNGGGPDFQVVVDPTGLELSADEGMVEQVLINLIRNSMQALGDRPGTIRISARVNPRNRTVLEVADDGPGIPPALADKVFYPFFTTRRDGSGVGLALTRQVMLAHGGSVRLTERAGGGACFILTF